LLLELDLTRELVDDIECIGYSHDDHGRADNRGNDDNDGG
jgi:hypothetical protein